MNVYELDREKNNKGFDCYQQMIVADIQLSKKLKEYESRSKWFDNRQIIGESWFFIQVEKWEHTYSHTSGDYPSMAGFPSSTVTPFFSQHASDSLVDLLEGNGELLPLISDFGQYYAFNITREVEALDEERSEFKLLSELDPDLLSISPETSDFLCISRYEFSAERIAELSIFKLPKRYHSEMPLVTDRFVQRVQDANLKGFAFKLLWSFENE
jgi:hypothetical protein